MMPCSKPASPTACTSRVGDEVKLAATRGGLSGGIKTLKITGLLSPRGTAGFNQAGIIFLPLKTAEQFFSRTGNVNTVSVVLQ